MSITIRPTPATRAGIALISSEIQAVRWRQWRHETDGVSGEELLRELRQMLVSDPARAGPYVATERVLLVGASLDEVVPRRHQDLLWESFGRPERQILPLGHYTAMLAFDSVLGSVDEFLRRRFDESEGLAVPPP